MKKYKRKALVICLEIMFIDSKELKQMIRHMILMKFLNGK